MPVHTDKIKILIVEDFLFTRKMEVRALKELGFENIIEAEDSQTAMRKVREEEHIGLIICDWNMPGISGFDFLSWLRGNDAFRDIPLIMATAQGEKKKVIRAMEEGADHFISKPFSSQELKTVIDEVFGREDSSGESFEKNTPLTPHTVGGKLCIDIAHLQITDHLILGILEHQIANGEVEPEHFLLKSRCMLSWNQVQQHLEKGNVQAAFVLAPLAMDLFHYDVPIRLLLYTHKNGSICVRSRRRRDQTSLYQSLKFGTYYIPHTMSVHYMLIHMFLDEIGLKLGPVGMPDADVYFEVVPPVRMPDFLLRNPESCGFMVAEPFGTQAINAGISDFMFFSGELWENHPCCALVMRDEIIESHPEAVQEFVTLLVRAGQFIHAHPDQAAEIALPFLDPQGSLELNLPIIRNVLTQPGGIRTDDLFPCSEDLDRIQKYMSEKMGIGGIVSLDKFVDKDFAEAAYRNLPYRSHPSDYRGPAEIVAGMLQREIIGKDSADRVQDIAVELSEKKDRIILRPSGNITAAVSEQLLSLLKNFMKDRFLKYRFDFSQVHDMDDTGLSVLTVLDKMLSPGSDIEIVNADPEIAHFFRLLRQEHSFRIMEQI